MLSAEKIEKLVTKTTEKWAKVRKAEERDAARQWRRREYLVRTCRRTVKDVAYEVMEQAYLKASSGGRLPAHARQIMYAARGAILEQTDKGKLDDQYFCQMLLPDYVRDHAQAQSWDVVFDARGHLEEPHTDRNVALGTLEVRGYLREIAEHVPPDMTAAMGMAEEWEFPTVGPRHRYSAILFIEKEGFLPLFRAVGLAARYDLAIMTTKGVTVTACRQLVDRLCGVHDGVPLFVLHDFDKAGFSILRTLTGDTRRYEFTNDVNVIDLGLRLEDVNACGLESEAVGYGRSDPRFNLLKNGATEEEIAFLCDSAECGYSGRRVELNAFASQDLVDWIEGKLQRHGVRKVVPEAQRLAAAYQRALKREVLSRLLCRLEETVEDRVGKVEIPEDLAEQIQQRLEAAPTAAWDRVLASLAMGAGADVARDGDLLAGLCVGGGGVE